MPMYDVHVYAVVRVKVAGVEAQSHQEACHEAMEDIENKTTGLQRLFEHHIRGSASVVTEYAEEVSGFLVDGAGQESGDSVYFNSLRQPSTMETCQERDQRLAELEARYADVVEKDPIEKEYLDNLGLACPVCKKTDGINPGNRVQLDGGSACQEVSCNNCRSSWRDLYDLTGMVSLVTSQKVACSQAPK